MIYAKTLRQAITVRKATPDDDVDIARLRYMQERDFTGDVPVVRGIEFFVAETGGRVVAVSGGSYVPKTRSAIVTDFYDDGTKDGKRGLVALLDDAMRSHVKLYIQVPFDRPELRDWLERKGVRWIAWSGEYP